MAACHDVVRRDPWQPAASSRQPAAGNRTPQQPAAALRIACVITLPPRALPATEVRAFSALSQRPAPFSRRRMAIRRSPVHAAAFCSGFCRSRTCSSVHGHATCTSLCNARTSRRMAHASSALPGTKPPTRAPTPGFPAGAAAKVGPSGAHTPASCRPSDSDGPWDSWARAGRNPQHTQAARSRPDAYGNASHIPRGNA